MLKSFLLTLLLSVTLRERDLTDAESFVSVVGPSADEEIREVLTEERSITEKVPRLVDEDRKITEMAGRRLQEVPQLPVTVTERNDDWWVLLDVLPRETSYVPPGIAEIPCTASKLYQSEQLY